MDLHAIETAVYGRTRAVLLHTEGVKLKAETFIVKGPILHFSLASPQAILDNTAAHTLHYYQA